MRFLERTLQYCWLDTQCLVLSPAKIWFGISNSIPEKINIKFMASLFGRAKINPGNVARPAGFKLRPPNSYHCNFRCHPGVFVAWMDTQLTLESFKTPGSVELFYASYYQVYNRTHTGCLVKRTPFRIKIYEV